MCNCSNNREFIGVVRVVDNITADKDISLKHVLKIDCVLATNTPVTVGETERIEAQGDNACIGSGCPLPFLDDQKLKIVFDDQPADTTKMLTVVSTKIVPNPNYKECTCNCQ
jgi:hypothetical protein